MPQKKTNQSGQDYAVLVIDSNRNIFDVLCQCASEHGFSAHHAPTLRDGLNHKREESYDIILTRDLLPDGNACFSINELLTEFNSPEIIVYTTAGHAEHAEHALKCGVWDYIIDPAPENIITDLLKRALRYRQSKIRKQEGEDQEISLELSSQGIIGSSRAIQNCINMTAKISQSDANVLISGESGTGKELFAQAIHDFSSRSKNPLIVVDCAALPSTLVARILFGHTRGSFTGADKAQPGLIKQADGGTLFLDEIGEMPLEIQKKFLRVIQERKYRPVGSHIEVKSNFRLIAATNRDLHRMAKEETFREDLLYRLKTFHLELPPLRQRSADIMELAYYCRDNYCRRNRLKKKKFSSDYLMMLTQYEWPGNVRELFQTIERSIADAHDSTVCYSKHLPVNIRLQVTKKKLANGGQLEEKFSQTDDPGADLSTLPTIKEIRDRAIEAEEKKYLAKLLSLAAGDIQQCCTTAGLSRSRFYDLLKKYNISR